MRRGASLVETIVALSLMGFIMLFVFEVFTTTRKGVHLSESRSNAAMLGRSLLDEVRRAGFDAAVATRGTHTFASRGDGIDVDQRVDWTRGVEAAGVDRKAVWITLSWREPTGEKKVVLETILRR